MHQFSVLMIALNNYSIWLSQISRYFLVDCHVKMDFHTETGYVAMCVFFTSMLENTVIIAMYIFN